MSLPSATSGSDGARRVAKASERLVTDVVVIFGVWLALMATFLLLGRAGYGTGLLVPALGEDQNWTVLLQAPSLRDVANGFWKLDGRNPLSPWFYILAKPLIAMPGGISILHYLVSLLLGLATYTLLRTLLRGQHRWYVLSISVVVVVNQSNAYFDHIIWNFQLALSCTLLAISAYIHFLDSDRRAVWAYGISLVLWCAAFQTYTLQSGAIVAIGLLTLHRRLKRNAQGLPAGGTELLRGLLSDFLDLAPFVFLFFMFIMVWTTATPAGAGFAYTFALNRLVSSVGAGLAHPDLRLMSQVLALSSFAVVYVSVSVVFALAGTGLIGMVSRIGDERSITNEKILLAIAIFVAIAVPTIILEAGGADWPPGSRWRMIYQVTMPALLMSLVLIGVSSVRGRFANGVAGLALFALLTVSVCFSLAHKERQVALAKSETKVRLAIQDALSSFAEPREKLLVLLQTENSFWWFASESLRGAYMRAWFPGAQIEYRVLADPTHVASNPTRIVFTAQGLKTAGEVDSLVPYRQVVLLSATGAQVLRRFELSREDAISHNGEWQLDADRITLH